MNLSEGCRTQPSPKARLNEKRPTREERPPKGQLEPAHALSTQPKAEPEHETAHHQQAKGATQSQVGGRRAHV